MLRQITPKPPIQPPRVPPADAAEASRLEGAAAELRKQIQLANKMGETAAADQARQKLHQVNSQLEVLDAPTPQPVTTPSPEVQRTPPQQTAPVLPAVTTAQPVNFVPARLDLTSPPTTALPVDNTPQPADTDDTAAVPTANEIVTQVTGGKSIDQIAQEQGMTRDQVIIALRNGNMQVTTTEPTSDNGDVQATVIHDPATGRSVTEYYDYQHDNYHTRVNDGGAETVSPMRDGSGRQETSSFDADTGAVTTRYEDDLGSGTVTEETSLPSGARVETVTPGNGAAPTTTVNLANGEEITLAPNQDTSPESLQEMQDQLAEGKSIAQIAEDRGLTEEQVIAEFEAAGFEVEIRAPVSDNGDVQTVEVTNPHTNETTAYYYDYQHDQRTVVTTSDGTETTDSVDGNGRTTHTVRDTETGESRTNIVDPTAGTEIEIVVDEDGRTTKTTTEQVNGGEPITHEVAPDENLSQIAEDNGVTLEDLRETNPELFGPGRDPDLIHPGEDVVIEGATRTTVEITFNGYTVTQAQDGTVTVANQEHDYEIELEADSLEADLAGLLTEVNPNSSDPEEAREAETVLNTLDGIFASEAIQQEAAGLDLEAVEGLGEVSAATREAIEEHGPGILAEPVVDQDGEVLDLYGERPEGAGADWVPLDWQGMVRWVHPDVARALMTDSETLATISELSAVVDLSNAQSDVYALDPDRAGAQAGAEDTLNAVLNPHGYAIDFKQPDGSLEDAREALTGAQTVLDDAAEVRSTYEEASSALDRAIEANGDLDPLAAAPDPNAPETTAEDSNIHTDVYQQEEYATSRAEHAGVEALFGEYNRLIAEGDLGSIELAITRNEQAGVDTQSPDHQNLLSLRDLAQNRVELAQANADYLRAESDLRTFEADSARMMRDMFDEWAEGNSSGGEDMYARAYVTVDGQAMIDLYYDHGHYVEEYNIDRPMADHSRHGQSIRLSVFDQDLNPEVSRNPPGPWIDESLNTAWNEHVATGVPEGKSLNTAWNEHPEGIPRGYEIYTHGQTFIAARENAAADLNELIASNADTALEGLNEALSAARSQFESDLAEHGPGTTELPEGAFPDGVDPVSIEWQGQTIMVSPDVKEQLEAGNLDAVIQSGMPIQVQIDVTPDDGEHNPESRWVAPELALSTLDLAAVNTEIGNLEVFRDQLNGTAVGQRDTAENTHNYYMPNLVQDERLENDRENVLNADFQSQFQSLYQSGFDGSFHIQEGEALEQTIRDSLGLDAGNEDHADIVESVAEGIREFGGDTPEVSTIPIFYVDENGTSQTMLFGVRNGEGETVYVDITGKRYTDIEDFRHNNEQFSDNGQVVYANDLDMTPGEDGRIEIDAQQARVLSAWESTIDPIVGIGTGIATILSFTPAAPIAAPIALAGGAYLGTRAVINQHEHISRGGDWDDTQSIMNLASIATTALPLGSSALRLGGLVRAGVPRGTAFMASIGGTRATNAYADDIARYMQSGATSNRIAYGINATTIAAGVPLVGVSGYDIVVHGGEMNGLQFANAMLNLGAGAFGSGMGIKGLSVRPGSGQTGSRGQYTQQGAPDGVVPDGVIPPGDTTGRPAITAGDRGRPMIVHEQDPDGVYRPTGEEVYHSPDHPVIEGEVAGMNDGGPMGPTGRPEIEAGSGAEGGSRQPTRDTTRPVLSDEDGEPIHLVWDPATQTFNGLPERNTGEYIYTSGKDPATPSIYLERLTHQEWAAQEGLTLEQLAAREGVSVEELGSDGVLRPPRNLSHEEVVARYESESRYLSRHELAERYGPNGPIPPERSIQDMLPDLRVGVSVRVRAYGGDLDIGSPTMGAVGFGLGTKTDYGMIGWSIVDSFSQRSLKPLRDALMLGGAVSVRPQEYRNITALQAGVLPYSNQLAFPIRASDLSTVAQEALFTADSGFDARLRGAEIVGPTRDGNATVVEVTYSPSLKAEEFTPTVGEYDFMGVQASENDVFYRLQGRLPYDRVMTEQKATIRPPAVAEQIPEVGALPRVGGERRPESTIHDGPSAGDTLVREHFDQVQSALGSIRLKVQLAVDPARAQELVTAVERGDIQAVRAMADDGAIDPARALSLVDGSLASGMRMSAVPNKPSHRYIRTLTGDLVRTPNPESMLVDILFNVATADRFLTRALYKLKNKMRGPLGIESGPPPQPRQMPSGNEVNRNLYGRYGRPATRYTAFFSSPPVPLPGAEPLAVSAEIRFQYKSNPKKSASAISRNRTSEIAFAQMNGRTETLSMPVWLADVVQNASQRSPMIVPRGGQKSLEQFLNQLESRARPDQRATIEQFRSEYGPVLSDGMFVRSNAADGVLTFLSSQVGERTSGPIYIRDANGQATIASRFGPLPLSAENIYVPAADGTPVRGDDPALSHKTHIFVRDPETGEPAVIPWVRGGSDDHRPGGPDGTPGPRGAPPENGSRDQAPPQIAGRPVPREINAAPPTSFTLEQIRNMRQPDKWRAGEIYTRELNRSSGGEHFPIAPRADGDHPVSGEGGRFVDVVERRVNGDLSALEVKTWNRWTTVNGEPQQREVPLTPKLQEQINKDVAARESVPGYQPRWVFLDAPPSPQLLQALNEARIIGNIMVHPPPRGS